MLVSREGARQCVGRAPSTAISCPPSMRGRGGVRKRTLAISQAFPRPHTSPLARPRVSTGCCHRPRRYTTSTGRRAAQTSQRLCRHPSEAQGVPSANRGGTARKLPRALTTRATATLTTRLFPFGPALRWPAPISTLPICLLSLPTQKGQLGGPCSRRTRRSR